MVSKYAIIISISSYILYSLYATILLVIVGVIAIIMLINVVYLSLMSFVLYIIYYNNIALVLFLDTNILFATNCFALPLICFRFPIGHLLYLKWQ